MTVPSNQLPARLGGGEMFNRIAQRYDRMNSLLSLGLHHSWRRQLVAALGTLGPNDRVLDVASGTADVALEVLKTHEGVSVVGLDPSDGMLSIGRDKAKDRGLSERIELLVGDVQAMDFPDDHFAGATISFGIRNVPDRAKGLSEMVRVTRPGGRVCVLELGVPRSGVLAPFARLHMRFIVPWLGALLAGDREYRYLQESIEAFPTPEAFQEMMERAGLRHVTITPQTFGAAHLYVGEVIG